MQANSDSIRMLFLTSWKAMLKSTRGNVRLEEKRKLSSHSPRALRTIQLPFACFSFHLSFPLGYVDLQAAMPAKRTEERRAFPMRCCKYVCTNTQPSRRASSPPPPLNPRSTLGSSSPYLRCLSSFSFSPSFYGTRLFFFFTSVLSALDWSSVVLLALLPISFSPLVSVRHRFLSVLRTIFFFPSAKPQLSIQGP